MVPCRSYPQLAACRRCRQLSVMKVQRFEFQIRKNNLAEFHDRSATLSQRRSCIFGKRQRSMSQHIIKHDGCPLLPISQFLDPQMLPLCSLQLWHWWRRSSSAASPAFSFYNSRRITSPLGWFSPPHRTHRYFVVHPCIINLLAP